MTGTAVAGLGGVYATLAARAGALQLLPAALVFALAGVWVAWIDVDVHRIPHHVLAKAAPAAAAAGWVGAAAMGESARIGTSLEAAAVLVVFYYLLAYLGDLGLGDVRLGDVRLAGIAGLLLGVHGWTSVLRGTFAAFMIGGLAARVLLAGRRHTSDLAFGPAIVRGTLVAVVMA